jgi:hypothetical protein
MGISRHLICITTGFVYLRENTLLRPAQFGFDRKALGPGPPRVASYPKVRLDQQWVVAKLAALGFEVRRDRTPAAMVRIVAAKA